MDNDPNTNDPNTPEFIVDDSGEHAEYAGGMVRDITEGKTEYYNLFFGPMYDRWAEHLSKAKSKYPDITPGVPNWTLSVGPEEYARYIDSAARHFRIWIGARQRELWEWGRFGKFDPISTPEDEAAAVYFNINGLEELRERMTDE